jgi:hypothetical protein
MVRRAWRVTRAAVFTGVVNASAECTVVRPDSVRTARFAHGDRRRQGELRLGVGAGQLLRLVPGVLQLEGEQAQLDFAELRNPLEPS